MSKQTNLYKFLFACAAIFAILLAIDGVYAEDPVCEPKSIEINTASSEELQRIIHIGEVRAEQIIELRKEQPFSHLEDLDRVDGIVAGGKRLADIIEQGCVWVDDDLFAGGEEGEEGETITAALNISGLDIFLEQDIALSKECEVQDTEQSVHSFSGNFLGVCALEAAVREGFLESVELSNEFPEFGLFLEGINGLPNGSSPGGFWSLGHNGEEAQTGITALVLEDGDEVSFLYILFESEPEGDESPSEGESGGGDSGGSGGGDPLPLDINAALAKAVAFLQNQELSPDVAMALMAAGQSADISFLKTFSGDSAISYAKPILAITAAGQDPRTSTDEDFVAKMRSFTTDVQLGDPSLLNDDIWGILALRSAGVPASDSVIQNSKAFLLQNQNADGGWAWDVGGTSDTNDTAAAIMALLEAGMTENDSAVQQARQYLKEAQNSDGGFPYDPQSPFGTDSDGNSDAWVIMAIHKLGENPEAWTKSPENPIEHLLSLQDEDGGFWWVAPGTSEWNNKGATADAVIALSGKSFPVYSISVFQEQETAQEQIESTIGRSKSAPVRTIAEEVFAESQREEASRQEILREIQAELLRVAEKAREIERQLAVLAVQQVQRGQIQEALAREPAEPATTSSDVGGQAGPPQSPPEVGTSWRGLGGEQVEESAVAGRSEDSAKTAFRAEAAAGAGMLGFIRNNMLLLFVAALIFGFGIYRFSRFSFRK